MDRACAFLEIKGVRDDPEFYYLDGIATTPTPDHVGDIVEPMGVHFSLPMPLLWQHEHDQPVGEVFEARATADGISFKARIPRIKETGRLHDRVEEVVQSVKYRLVKGASIGFKAVSGKVKQLTNGGLHFLESVWHELSLVTIPMNSEATIHTIKSAYGAATGRSVVRLGATNVAGASANPNAVVKDQNVKTKQERLDAWNAKFANTEAMRTAIMQKAESDGDRTLSADEGEEYDRLGVELKEIKTHIDRVSAEVEVVKATAVAVVEDTTSRPRTVPHILNIKDHPEPGIAFAQYIKVHQWARHEHQDPVKLVQRMYPGSPRLHNLMREESNIGEVFAKANVTALNTQDAVGGGALVQYQDLLTEFLDWLRPQTILGKFGQGGVPALTRVDFLSRVRVQTSGGAGYWVGEGKPKPLTSFNFANITMAITKVANIAVMTEEEVRFSTPAADARVRNALAGALIERMDRDFIDPDFAGSANVSPASITYGAPTSAASGTINSAAIADQSTAVNSMLQYFPEATLSGLVWIMSGRTAYALGQAMNSLGQKQFPGIGISGGEIGGIPVITSEYLAYGGGLSPASNNIVILVHAPSIFLADDGGVRIDSSTEASLEMLTNPTNDVMTPTATSLVSMYQTDSIAVRAERMVNWKRARDNSVYVLTNVAYSGLAA